jgi:hypothetical protein
MLPPRPDRADGDESGLSRLKVGHGMFTNYAATRATNFRCHSR